MRKREIPEVETLITTVGLVDYRALLEKMNIQSSFVIGNQTDYNGDIEIHLENCSGRMVSRKERGVGRNRNALLSEASAPVCVFADDDMMFSDGYVDAVREAFMENNEADIIVFNIDDRHGSKRRANKRKTRVTAFNYMNYGAARLAFRRAAVSMAGVFFNENFGGGARFRCGEDSLFLRDAIKKGLVIIAVPTTIASLLDDRESTWFVGYDDKYLFDKGVFLGAAHPKLAYAFAFYLSVKHPEYRNSERNTMEVFTQIRNGIRYVKAKGYIDDI